MNDAEKVYANSFSNKLLGPDYFLVSSKHDKNSVYITFFSVWEPGDSSEFENLFKENKEYRIIDLVDPEKVIIDFALFEQKLSIVNDKEELLCVNNIGGPALISSSVLQKHWIEILKPVLTLKTENSFIDYASIAGKYLERFARGSYRMSIFSRDACQCRICGASPDDSVRVKLEIHHIKPWEEGGLSTPDNLITLCNICHDGIKEIDRKILYQKVGVRPSINNFEILSISKNSTHSQIIKYRYLQSNAVTIKVNKTGKNKKLFF